LENYVLLKPALKRIFNHIIFVLIAGFAGITILHAQNQAILEPQLMYRKQLQFGINMNSTGIGGLNFRKGWHKTDQVKNILDIELARVRDPKETRVYGASENPQRYTYDRINMAFFLRTGVGRSIRITERSYKNAISLYFNYNVGFTTAILKPIYIDYLVIEYDNNGLGNSYVTQVRYNPAIHTNPQNILGNSSFFYNISNSTMKLGGYGRGSLSVQFGQYPEEFHLIEAGCTLDFFPNPLPLMANRPERSLFFVLFIGYTFGLNK